MINEFKEKTSTSLIESIPLTTIKVQPSILYGSVGCIIFRANEKTINVCLDSEEKANNLFEAYNDFLRCRRGDNLNIIKTRTIMNILRASCNKYFFCFDILYIYNIN